MFWDDNYVVNLENPWYYLTVKDYLNPLRYFNNLFFLFIIIIIILPQASSDIDLFKE